MTLNISIMQYTMLTFGSILVIIWIYLYVKFKNEFNDLIDPLEKNEFFLSDIFFIGFGVMKLVNFNLKSANSKYKIKKIAEVQGNTYADYYYYVITGGKLTYVMTLIPVAFFIGAISRDILIFLLSIITVIVLILYLDMEIDNKITKRRDELLRDFPKVLSKLTLLLNTGMTLRQAWSNVLKSGESIIYIEMQKTYDEIANGVSEVESYKNFAERCAIKEIRKFSSILIQNIQKGNSEISSLIRELADEGWQQKKYNVKIKGELASSKLMLPVSIMLIAIFIMIMVPIFTSFMNI